MAAANVATCDWPAWLLCPPPKQRVGLTWPIHRTLIFRKRKGLWSQKNGGRKRRSVVLADYHAHLWLCTSFVSFRHFPPWACCGWVSHLSYHVLFPLVGSSVWLFSGIKRGKSGGMYLKWTAESQQRPIPTHTPLVCRGTKKTTVVLSPNSFLQPWHCTWNAHLIFSNVGTVFLGHDRPSIISYSHF